MKLRSRQANSTESMLPSCAAKRARSFTKAVIQLHYAQSSVTAQVHALETDLGLPLFNRLGRQQLLLTDGTCSYRALFERTLVQYGGRVNRLLEFASVEALKQCAVARMGVAVLPELVVANELKQGTLVVLPWPQARMHVYTQLIRHRDKWLSPAMDAFCTMAIKMLRETST